MTLIRRITFILIAVLVITANLCFSRSPQIVRRTTETSTIITTDKVISNNSFSNNKEHFFQHQNEYIGRYPFLWNETSNSLIKLKDFLNVNEILKLINGSNEIDQAELYQYHIERAAEYLNYFSRDPFHYSSQKELALSGGPPVNSLLCRQQLQWLHNQLTSNDTDAHTKLMFGKGKNKLNLARYIDSFGRPEAASYLGNSIWFGSYEQCLYSQFNFTSQSRNNTNQQADEMAGNDDKITNGASSLIKTRYCYGRLVSVGWPTNDTFVPKPTIKAGLCLPETCDTRSWSTTAPNGGPTGEIIQKLLLMNFAEHLKDRYKMVGLYCLPDERSELRQFQPAAWAFIGCSVVWLSIVFVATIYDCFILQPKRKKKLVAFEANCGQQRAAKKQGQDSTQYADGGSIVARDNKRRKYNVATPLPLVKIEEIVQLNNDTANNNRSCNDSRNQHKTKAMRLFEELVGIFSFRQNYQEFVSIDDLIKRTEHINLVPINMFKVVCALLVINGHAIVINTVQYKIPGLSFEMMPRKSVLLTQSLPLSVDTFFIMAGLLYGFSVMRRFTKSKKPYSDLIKPLGYLQYQANTFLKICPVYMILYWFNYSFASLLSSGPSWDYGTDRNSYRGLCKQTSQWYHYVLYFNHLSPDPFPPCLGTGWFLEVYLKVFLLVPPLTYLMLRFRRFRVALVAVLMIVPFVQFSKWMYNTSVADSRTIQKNFSITFVLEAKYYGIFHYTDILYRLPETLAGVLAGIMIYEYNTYREQQQQQQQQQQLTEQQQDGVTEGFEENKLSPVKSVQQNNNYWPSWMRGIWFKLAVWAHVVIFGWPALLTYVTDYYDSISGINYDNENFRKLIVSFQMPCLLFAWTVVNLIVILRLSTDVAKQSKWSRHRIWIVLSRITYCMYLIHVEVLVYLVYYDYHIRTHFNGDKVIREFFISVPIIMALSLFVQLALKAPLDKLINKLLRIS